MSTHIEASLQRDLERIRSRLAAMCGLCVQAIQAGAKALAERNRQIAYAVILRDRYVDEMEKEVDRLCLEFLVRQQPVAGMLRFAYSAIKINLDLERVGDYAESIARQTLKLIPMEVQIPVHRLTEIAELSSCMVKDAIRAFLEQNADLARKTIEVEEAVDQLKSKLNKDFVALFREQKLPFEALNPLMMIARHLERISDQARNISQEAIYVCTGEDSRHPDADIIRVLFVDEHNSCGSQMAEAIGRGLNQPRFVFASAGVDPKPIGSAAKRFMEGKGMDVSRMVPKAINQVPNLDHYQVIILLAKPAQAAFPPSLRSVVLLDWSLEDPAAVQGTPDQVTANLEHAFEFIQEHLNDLVQAILKD